MDPIYTPSPDDLVDKVVDAHRRLQDHDNDRQCLLIERRDAIRAALAGGAQATTLARVLGVSRNRVYVMRDTGRR